MIRTISFFAALLIGCAPQGQPGDSVPAPEGAPAVESSPDAAAAVERVVGTVRVVGSAPVNVQTVLQDDSGHATRLAGPLAAELQRLRGARVAVYGPLTPTADPMAAGELRAIDYEILEINGAPVIAGEIVSRSGDTARLRMDDGSEIELHSPPSSFRVGQKVWVQGSRSINVQSYGTIRP